MFQLDRSSFAVGRHTLVITATDADGLSNTFEYQFTVTPRKYLVSVLPLSQEN